MRAITVTPTGAKSPTTRVGHTRRAPKCSVRVRDPHVDPTRVRCQVVDDWNALAVREQIRASSDPWSAFLARIADGSLRVTFSNQGNVFLTAANAHPGEFAAHLMQWVRTKDPNAPAVVTGQGGALASGDERYRLWFLDGCRTDDYVTSLRATPGLDARNLDLLANTRTSFPDGNLERFATLLDGLLAQRSLGPIVRALNALHEREGPIVTPVGFADNPRVK